MGHFAPLSLLAVAAGGAVGAVCRYALGVWLNSGAKGLMWGTIAANLSGALLAGMLLAYLETRAMHEGLRLALQVGFLGALTTFSTFSVEVVQYLQRGKLGFAVAHVLVNLLLSLVLVYAGYRLFK